MSRFQIFPFFHVVYLREFVNLLLVEITYIMNAHQELAEILEVSSTVYINIYQGNIYY